MSNIYAHIANIVFIFSLGFYLLQNLQWFNYNLLRVFTKHTKPQWHAVFIVLPCVLFFALGEYFIFYLALHLILLGFWYFKLDKKLVFTSRVKRFFTTLAILAAIDFVFLYVFELPHYISFVSLAVALAISYVSEVIIMQQYKTLATQKLDSMHNLRIIAITASFGKTSIKNFIFALLSQKYNIHMTARSINTINGIISDINNNLAAEHNVYILEAGARKIGDIAKIANLTNPHYAIIGEIGEMHLQYFKNIENIRRAKYELLTSTRLREVFLFRDNEEPQTNAKITRFPPELKNVNCTLDGTSFSMKINDKFYDFKTKLLGRFNVSNLCAAILLAHEFGVEISDIKNAIKNLDFVPHRLQKIEANGKIILDDSFNGNLNGMSEAIRIAGLHKGRKVIVTPGIVENNEENNIELAQKISEVFDIAIITGSANSKILSTHISRAQKIILKDKANLENLLAQVCHNGDLILFANDAPSYV